MQIALVTHNVIKGDGQGRANYEITRGALAQGHQVSLFSQKVAPELLEMGANWVPVIPRQNKIGLLTIIEAAVRANQLLKKHKGAFDVIHGYGYTSTQATDLSTAQFVHSAWLRNASHPIRIQPGAHNFYQGLYTFLNSRWERGCFNRARRVSAVSRSVRADLESIAVPSSKIEVIPNGVDTDEFVPGAADRAQLGLPTDVPLVLFTGDIRLPRKNLDTVLKGLVQAPGVHLIVVGNATGSPYPKMAEALGISDRVHFLGYRKDVPQIMQAVDVFVFPSRYEPFGMVVVEAMAVGLPVITAASTGASEIITPESGIVLASSEDADGLAQSLRQLVGDEEMRRAMGAAARLRAVEYSWPRIVEQYMRVYGTLAS